MADSATVWQRTGLLARTSTAVIGGLIFLGLAWVGGPWWAGLWAVLIAIGGDEYAGLHALSAAARVAVIAGAVLVLAAGTWSAAAGWVWGLSALIVLAGGIVPWVRGRLAPPALWTRWRAVALVLGIAYLGLPAAVLVRWRLDGGFAPVLAFLLIIWAADIAAYFVGLAAGRHKLAPRVSPGKSWEGAAASVVAAAVVGALAAATFRLPVAGGLVVGAATNVAAQLGDLFESTMKRKAGVKDSGRLLPGHGGILDRFDSVFIAAPVAYGLLRIWGGR